MSLFSLPHGRTCWIFGITSPRKIIDAADRVRTSIQEALSLIADNPSSGHTRSDLTPKPLRFWSVRGYLIIYQIEADAVTVVRVLHGRRDVKAILRKHFKQK
jgi:plasmid stabilization system protein ParE